MRISGNEPSSVILRQTDQFKPSLNMGMNLAMAEVTTHIAPNDVIISTQNIQILEKQCFCIRVSNQLQAYVM